MTDPAVTAPRTAAILAHASRHLEDWDAGKAPSKGSLTATIRDLLGVVAWQQERLAALEQAARAWAQTSPGYFHACPDCVALEQALAAFDTPPAAEPAP
jgi:hypothetical protein